MRPHLLRSCVAVFAVAGFLVLAPRASAEYLTLNFQGETSNPGNPSVAVTLNGTQYSNFAVGPFYWSQNSVPLNNNFPQSVASFCLEINATQPLPAIGSNTTFSVLNPQSAPTIGGDAAKVAAIQELYGRYFNPAWNNSSTFHGDVNSVAFQLALWELVYDGAKDPNLSSGHFDAAGLGIYTTTAQDMLNSLTGDTSYFNNNLSGYDLVTLVAPAPGSKTQDMVQDQIILQPKGTPAPPALMLAGIGVLALLGRARWNRRTPPGA